MIDRLERHDLLEGHDASETLDGRHLRRERNREAVVDALLALYREGNLDPGSAEIAERAGLSPRSLFRYFDDVDDLCRAAIRRHQERVLALSVVPVAATDPFDVRLAAFVEQRTTLFDAIGSVGQVARLRAPFQPLVATELAQIRAHLRNQIKQLFAPELAAMDAAGAAGVLAAADVLCSFESYQLLRFDQRLTRARTVAVLGDVLRGLFEATR